MGHCAQRSSATRSPVLLRRGQSRESNRCCVSTFPSFQCRIPVCADSSLLFNQDDYSDWGLVVRLGVYHPPLIVKTRAPHGSGSPELHAFSPLDAFSAQDRFLLWGIPGSRLSSCSRLSTWLKAVDQLLDCISGKAAFLRL